MYVRDLYARNFLENALKVLVASSLVYKTKIFSSDAQSFMSYNRSTYLEKWGLKSRSACRFFLRKAARKTSVKIGPSLLFFTHLTLNLIF